MKGKFRLTLTCILLVLVLVSSALLAVACNNDNTPYNPYDADNNFDVEVTDGDDEIEFAPVGFTPSFGVVFYIGMIESPSDYEYLARALAKQGYLTVISKVRNVNLEGRYDANISTLAKYPTVKFFLGGHDVGGGLAVRHAMDYAKNNYNVAGMILYTPREFTKQQKDENGHFVLDDDNNPVIDHFSIADFSIRTLLLEVDDELRVDEFKQTTLEHINNSVTTRYTLENAMSTYFSTMSPSSGTDENAVSQREKTVEYTLSFLREIARMNVLNVIECD